MKRFALKYTAQLRFFGTALVTSITISLVTLLFSRVVDFLALLPQSLPWLTFSLPLAALLSYGIYRLFGIDFASSTSSVMADIRSGRGSPPALAPSVFISTCLTIVAGGAVGKEAASLQMGSSLSAALGETSGLAPHHNRALARCGVAAAFATLVGAPLASAVLSYEMARRKLCDKFAAVMAVLSAFVGYGIGAAAKMPWLNVRLEYANLLDAKMLASCAAGILIGVLFCLGIKGIRALSGKFRSKWPLVVMAGLAVAALALLLGGDPVSGTGWAQMSSAFSGGSDWTILAARFAAPVLLLGAGYKGGEIMPMMAVGAVAGSLMAIVLEADPACGAAVGMVSCFAASTNTPATSLLLGCELFGFQFIVFFALAAVAAYALTTNISLFGNESRFADAWRWELSSSLRSGNSSSGKSSS